MKPINEKEVEIIIQEIKESKFAISKEEEEALRETAKLGKLTRFNPIANHD